MDLANSNDQIITRLHQRLLFLEAIAERKITHMASQGEFMCEICVASIKPGCDCASRAEKYRADLLAKSSAIETTRRDFIYAVTICASVAIIFPLALCLAFKNAK